MNSKEQNNIPLREGKVVYEKPSIEIIEMEMESSILQGSAPGYAPGGGSEWN